MPDALEYYVTLNAHDPDTLTRHMNDMAHDGWELLTVDFAVRGETGFILSSGGARSAQASRVRQRHHDRHRRCMQRHPGR
jgi:hypothetical protein